MHASCPQAAVLSSHEEQLIGASKPTAPSEPTSAEHASSATAADAASTRAVVWTDRNARIHAWIRAKSESLAELYQGAVMMLVNKSPPGYTRLVCHAGREIGNRFPPLVGALIGKRIEYASRLDAIVALTENSPSASTPEVESAIANR